MLAARLDRAGCVGVLLAAGAAVNAEHGRDRYTALHCCCQSDSWLSYDCARLLLDDGADRNAQDAEGKTALISAIEHMEAESEKLKKEMETSQHI